MSDLATDEEAGAVRKLLLDSALSRAKDALSLIDRHVRLSYFEKSPEHITRIYGIRAVSAIDKGRGHIGWEELAMGLELQLAAEPTAMMRLYFHALSETTLGAPLLIFTNSTTTKLLGVLVGTAESDNPTTPPLDEHETELTGKLNGD